ncbi:MAG: dihydrolipoyl dehydrogenase [bacterium]
MLDIYDIAILGGGPGGYVSALRAGKLGAKVCVIESDFIGGTCLNKGCIPTKVMIEAAHRYYNASHSQEYGVEIDSVRFNYENMLKTRDEIVKNLRDGIIHLFKHYKINLINGYGRLKSENTIDVEGVGDIKAKNIILATGSKPSSLPGLEIDSRFVLTSDDVLNLNNLPNSVIIVGAGPTGCEFAYIFACLGVKVHLIEVLDRILPANDKRASRVLAGKLKGIGVEIMTKNTIKSWSKKNDGVEAILLDNKKILSDFIFLSVGRVPDNDAFKDIKGIRFDKKGYVITDNRMHTSIGNIYAIGDIVPTGMLAHKASYEGIVAIENIMGIPNEARYDTIPKVVYTVPEVAQVGPTEEELERDGIEYNVSIFQYRALGRALAIGDRDGFAKVIADKDGHLIAGTIVGLCAGELIGEVALGILSGIKIEEMKNLVHNHPSLSEATGEALWGLSGRMIHSVQ